MVSLAGLADYVMMLVVSAVFGSVGGLGFELLQTRDVAKATVAVAAAGGGTTDAVELPHPISKTLYDLGVWGSLIIGGIAAIGALYFFPPQITIQLTGADGAAKTITQYDLIKLVALSLIVGSAGPSFLNAMQSRVQLALSEQKVDQTKKVSEQKMQKLTVDAANEVRKAMTDALSARSGELQRSIRAAAEADVRTADETTPETTDQVSRLFRTASDDAAARVQSALSTQVEEAKNTLALL
ncbi:MAG: hypothetical protein KGK34_04665 [Chloroflexota bacterium]|nr:hypothetical protein [Chloroflexota bacterium]